MIIETERLVLRDYKEDDWERVHIYGKNPEVSKYDAWGPNSEKETRNFIGFCIDGQKDNPRFKFEFAIIEKESGLLVGGTGLRQDFPGSSVADLGYVVNPDYQGKGIATEATNALIDFAFKTLKTKVVWATCDTRNATSIRVLEKCNLRRIGIWKEHKEIKGSMRDSFRFEIINLEGTK